MQEAAITPRSEFRTSRKEENDMKTGRDANRSGWYISECCLKEVALIEGQMCPRCPNCSALTVWEFVKSLGGRFDV
jgi:hypothetical protein